jgi:DNA-binding CsgD family transcriptional regulator
VPARRNGGELPPGGAQAVTDIAHIAAAPGGAVERADALLGALRRLMPFDASFVALLHPERREHLSLVRSGYDERTCAYLDGPVWMDDIELLGLREARSPIRLCDFPVRPEAVHCWAEYLVPAGFREGLGVGLFTSDGRYLGVLGLHSVSAVPVTDAVRDLVGMLAPLLAHAVDPMREAGAVAGLVHDAVAGIALTDGGAVLPLPGLPGHPLLAAGSPVLAVVAAGRSTGEGRLQTSFLCPGLTDGRADHHLRITLLAMPPGDLPYEVTTVVVVSPPGDLYGLTSRELEVLGLLVEGWPNQPIAAGLEITERTVAAHVEHIMVKLAAPSRTVAAVSALRLGLFVPRLLHHGALSGDPADR